MSKKRVFVNEIAEELFVSNTTIHKDLEEVQRWLADFNLILIKKGIKVLRLKGKKMIIEEPFQS
ncbi:HTH domain-containing protein [Clostridium magnum]|uniref:HTH domain-containing protein n=1 Tax=Clostridium magnum TaxID=33954 RepID=UPI0009EE535C|nr:HTH domain-containing protein [Clostridium magnum]